MRGCALSRLLDDEKLSAAPINGSRLVSDVGDLILHPRLAFTKKYCIQSEITSCNSNYVAFIGSVLRFPKHKTVFFI